MWKKMIRAIVPAPVRRALQRWRLSWMVARFAKRMVRHRYGDVELDVELADPLAAGWYDRDWPLPPEIGLLRKSQLALGAVVFDLGAHQGIVALMLGREVGPTGRVIAVEALPHNATAAARNRDLNRMPWVEVVSAAVAAQDGTLTISRALNAQVAIASDYAGTFEVPAVTIDTLAERYSPPDVVYLDVEGMELAALLGARAVLAGRPDVFVAVHVGCGLEAAGALVEQVLACFPERDYELYVHTEDSPVPVPRAAAPPGLFTSRFFLTAVARRAGT